MTSPILVRVSSLREGDPFETALTNGAGTVLHVPKPWHGEAIGIRVAIDYPRLPTVERWLHPDVYVRRAS